MELTEKEKKACKKPYLNIVLVAKIMGVDRRTAKVWAANHNVLVEINGMQKVSREKLKTEFPDTYREIAQLDYESEDDDFSE